MKPESIDSCENMEFVEHINQRGLEADCNGCIGQLGEVTLCSLEVRTPRSVSGGELVGGWVVTPQEASLFTGRIALPLAVEVFLPNRYR